MTSIANADCRMPFMVFKAGFDNAESVRKFGRGQMQVQPGHANFVIDALKSVGPAAAFCVPGEFTSQASAKCNKQAV